MPHFKRWRLGLLIAILIALIVSVGPALYAQARMSTTTGIVFVRGIIGSIPITVANIVTTSTDGLLLQNTTAASVGVPVQYSPRLRLCGTAWKTDATTASETDCDFLELRPASAAGATTSLLVWAASIAGGAYTDVMTLSQAGKLALAASNNQTLTISAATGTSAVYQRFTNGSGDYFNGLESSAGGAVFTGGLAYAAVTGPSTATALQLATTNAVRMTIAATGPVGIGTTVPGNSLDVKGTIGLGTNTGSAEPLTWSSAAPGISGFAGSSPAASVTAGSTTAAFRIGVGGTAPGTTGTITLPTATTGWNCWVVDQTTPLDITRQTASTTSQITITSTIAWTANDILVGGCTAF